MTADLKTQDSAQPTATLLILEADQAFYWRNCSYPVASCKTYQGYANGRAWKGFPTHFSLTPM